MFDLTSMTSMSPVGPVAMIGFAPNDMLIIGVLVFILFGGAKLAQLGKGLGEGIREFRTSMGGAVPEIDNAIDRTVERIAPANTPNN